MESMNPYQSPTADVSLRTGQDGFDESGPFSPSGRFGRLSYIAWNLVMFLPLTIAVMTLIGAGAATHLVAATFLMVIAYIAMIVIMVIFTIRRLHDFDSSGWLTLLLIVPIANLVLSLLLWFKPGTQGANNYAPPRVTRGWEKVFGYIGIGFMILYLIGTIAAIAIPSLLRLS